MSRYTFPGRESRYQITVGWDNTIPVVGGSTPGTLYAQVEDTMWASTQDGDTTNEEVGDTPEEGLRVWVGQGIDDVISDVQMIVQAVAPYGNIPLATQMNLLRDMDRDWPRSWSTVGSALVAICRHAPGARLASKPDPEKSYYILLNERGWQLREWQSLRAQGTDYERTLASMIITSDKARYSYADPLASYVSDPTIIFRIHPDGLSLGFPVFVAFDRGVMLAGPVVIAGEDGGLSPRQVQVVTQEVLFVEEQIRMSVTSLWTHVWSTIGSRSDG